MDGQNFEEHTVTYPATGIKIVTEVKGHSFACSDPASTSGHLFPAYGLRKGGLDPDRDVRALYAGSHTASSLAPAASAIA
jgi:phosphonate transport system substrate-binding protein